MDERQGVPAIGGGIVAAAIAVAAIACGAVALSFGRPAAARAAEPPLRVFVSILPEADLVRRVGGRHVTVEVMVGPGRSPETFAPTARQVAALAGTRVYFAIGVPFERVWLPRIRAASPGLEVVDLSAGLATRVMRGADGAPIPGGPPDPHVWTSPRLAREMVSRIAAALSRVDPAHRTEYAEGAGRTRAMLEALSRELAGILAPVRGRSFMVFHPAWGYLADDYGLVEVPIEVHGREPGARTLVRVVDVGRARGIRTVFVQPQASRTLAERVAAALGANVVELDPLAADYAANLRHVARVLAQAMEAR